MEKLSASRKKQQGRMMTLVSEHIANEVVSSPTRTSATLLGILYGMPYHKLLDVYEFTKKSDK